MAPKGFENLLQNKALFNTLYQIQLDINQMKGDLLKDSRIGFEEI